MKHRVLSLPNRYDSKGQGFEQCKCSQRFAAKIQRLTLIRKQGEGREGN